MPTLLDRLEYGLYPPLRPIRHDASDFNYGAKMEASPFTVKPDLPSEK